jgi:hypothetical protein
MKHSGQRKLNRVTVHIRTNTVLFGLVWSSIQPRVIRNWKKFLQHFARESILEDCNPNDCVNAHKNLPFVHSVKQSHHAIFIQPQRERGGKASTHAWDRHYMEVSDQRHAPAALQPRGKDPQYPQDRSLDGPRSWYGHRGQRNILCLSLKGKHVHSTKRFHLYIVFFCSNMLGNVRMRKNYPGALVSRKASASS